MIVVAQVRTSFQKRTKMQHLILHESDLQSSWQSRRRRRKRRNTPFHWKGGGSKETNDVNECEGGETRKWSQREADNTEVEKKFFSQLGSQNMKAAEWH